MFLELRIGDVMTNRLFPIWRYSFSRNPTFHDIKRAVLIGLRIKAWQLILQNKGEQKED